MEKYLLLDYGIVDIDFLRLSLIEEIERDTYENNEKNIIESNFKLLKKLNDEKYRNDIDFIISELNAFGYDILKIDNTLKDLKTLKNYLKYKNNDLSILVDNTISEIEEYIK